MDTRQANQQHGLSRSLLNSMVIGVNDGFEKTLNMVGVGYKAACTGKNLTLNLGYSHPIEMTVPEGIQVTVTRNTTILVSGFNKETVGQFASDIRSKREPEPTRARASSTRTRLSCARKESAESRGACEMELGCERCTQ